MAGGTGDSAISLVIDLLNPESCASLLPNGLKKVGQLDIFYANAGSYIGGDLLEANSAGIDCMLNLNVNAVMKNVHDVLPHMIERSTGNIVVNGSVAGHFPASWEPVYAMSKWGINRFASRRFLLAPF